MERQACWYSIVRYSPDELSGEIINVGVIVHSAVGDNILHYFLLDESSPKVRSIISSKAEELTYKSFKEILDYYLKESPKSLDGSVGGLEIGSPHSTNYLLELRKFFKNKKMNLSEPTFSLSSDISGLFKALFNSYVGEKYYPIGDKEQNIKSIVRKIFEDNHFMNTKVKQDIGLYPIPELPVKINVDFGFKNGVWNYMQVTPDIKNASKNTEWFTKTQFLIENVKDDAKVYLMYRKSSLHGEKNETMNIINYFNDKDRVFGVDLDDQSRMKNLCHKIEREAHLIEEVI
ncbi:DUF3037 domain-containing protein [Paenibacillus sp. FSL L8-0494]|uniref:DUF3037 domain-containing protein n=1 Tax=Paenibacillus sp. FSL L8-0494 TaxID=2975352 RepID=UPI0030F8CFB8